MNTPTRVLVTLLVPATLGGCTALASLWGEGSDTTVPLADPQPQGEIPEAAEATPSDEQLASDACPYMPTVGMARETMWRPFDWDSIRALPDETVDSLASAGALPRLDTLVARPVAGPTIRMPIVPLDSAGHPIRVVPLCRVVGGRR